MTNKALTYKLCQGFVFTPTHSLYSKVTFSPLFRLKDTLYVHLSLAV